MHWALCLSSSPMVRGPLHPPPWLFWTASLFSFWAPSSILSQARKFGAFEVCGLESGLRQRTFPCLCTCLHRSSFSFLPLRYADASLSALLFLGSAALRFRFVCESSSAAENLNLRVSTAAQKQPLPRILEEARIASLLADFSRTFTELQVYT